MVKLFTVLFILLTATISYAQQELDANSDNLIDASLLISGAPSDNTIVRFSEDGATDTFQSSLVTISDAGTINIPNGQTYNINGAAHTHAYIATDYFDGSSDAATSISLYDGNSNKTTISPGNSVADLTWTLPTAYPTVSGYVLTSSDAGVLSTSSAPSLLAITLYGQSAGAGAQIALGSASSSSDPNDGKILFRNLTNTNTFTIASGASGAALTWTLPTAAPGGANYLLNVDADGTMGYTDPASIGGGTGDVTGVGDCASGACFDGTSDGGTYVMLYDAEGRTKLQVGNNAGEVDLTLPITTGTLALVSGALGTPSFTALNMPSSNADPSTTAGQIRHDSTVANHANGAVRWWDGTNIRQVVDMVAATAEGCTNTQVVAYNATDDLFYCKDDANTGSATALNDIADAAADGTIAQTGYKQTWTSTLNTEGSVWTFTNTTADLTADVSFMDFKYTDNGDANGFFMRGYDNSGNDLKWSIGADGAAVLGVVTTGTASTLTGSIVLKNATNANSFTVNSGVSGADITWTLPTTVSGGANYLLNVDADGTMGYTDPAGFAASTIDVSGVGDCASGACLDGSSDGGTYIRLYDGDSHYTQLAAGNSSGNLTFTFPTAYPAASGYIMLMSDAGVISTTSTLTGLSFDLGDAPASGAGAVVAVDANGVLTTTITALLPDTADGATLGSAAAEWSDIYLADGGVIYFQNDQSVYLTPSAATLTLTGSFAATGSVTAGTSLLPDAADGATIGSATAEWSDIYLADGGVIYFQNDQSVYLTPSAGTLTLTGALVTSGAISPSSAGGAALGSASAEWDHLYLHDAAVIYGQADQSNTITSSATGWDLNKPLGLYSANDPDVAAEGKISWDANGDYMRGYDGTRQVAIARVQEEIHVTIYKPQDLDDAQRDHFWIWSNESGMSFVVTGWKGWSTSDNTTLDIKEEDADGQNDATVDAVEIATDGTGVYTGSDTTITAATIENGHLLYLDFDDTDAPAMVKMVIYGYYNSDVN